MKKTIDGQVVEGTPAEIAEYEQIVAAQDRHEQAGRRPQLVKTSPDPYYSLSPQLRDAYDALLLIDTGARAAQVADLLGVTTGAATQRLIRLVKAGLARRVKPGVYRPIRLAIA